VTRGALRRLASRTRTLGALVRHFAASGRWFFLPLLLVLLLSGILLLATSGLSYVAPLVYTLF